MSRLIEATVITARSTSTRDAEYAAVWLSGPICWYCWATNRVIVSLLPVMRPAAGSQDFTLDSHRALIAIECADCGLLRYHSLARLGLEPE